jgi:protein-S-isoprenylcysteine O-methyltransferase Ste14
MNANAICGYLWIVWWLTWVALAFGSKKTQQRESIASRLTYILVAWLAMSIMLAPLRYGSWLRTGILSYHPWMGYLGIAITAVGFALTFWARFTLGRNWSGNVTIKVDHELIRTGPYRFVRHPIYTGILTAFIGTALARDQWRGGVALLLLWLSFTIKRLKEEQFMRQTFGAQYVDYSNTTGAIFPTLLSRNS